MVVLDAAQAGRAVPNVVGDLYAAEWDWLDSIKRAAGVVALMVLVISFTTPGIQPSIEHDFADPSVLATAGGYYAYSTQSRYGDHIWHVPVQQASTLLGSWAPVGDALPQLPGWVAADAYGHTAVWAPEVTRRDDGAYLMYFTAPTGPAARCIGAALSRSPGGPFTPQPQPLVCQPENHDTIDAAAFTDADGSRYLLYVNGRAASTIWLQPLAPDGLGTTGRPLTLLRADRPEEASVVEAPTLTRRHGRYVLFYSANTFNSGHYFVNYATSTSLTSPFRKHDGALIATTSLQDGGTNPGGQDAFPAHDPSYLIFHAFAGAGGRSMFIVPLLWGDDGTPTVPLPAPAPTPTPAS